MRSIVAMALACAAGGACAAAPADFPTKGIRVVLGFTPGGGADAAARIAAQAFTDAWTFPAVVEHRAGAGGNIGTEAVARAAPDGYTVLLTPPGPIAVNQSLYRKLPFDPEKDFAAVTLVAEGPNVLVVHPSVPVRSVRDFLALARSRPDVLTYASSGVGSTPHLSGELLNLAARLKLTHVPYRGAAPAVVDLMGGRVDLMLVSVPSIISQVQAGRLRALAVTTAQRTSALPDVPTLAEAGVPGYQASAWWGVVAPAATPAEIVGKLQGAIAAALRGAQVRDLLQRHGADAVGNTPTQFTAFLAEERRKWARVVKEAGIQPQ